MDRIPYGIIPSVWNSEDLANYDRVWIWCADSIRLDDTRLGTEYHFVYFDDVLPTDVQIMTFGKQACLSGGCECILSLLRVRCYSFLCLIRGVVGGD